MATKRQKGLVIVESPAKAKKINSFLGSEYTVLASMGHVCDLPQPAAAIPTEIKKEKPWTKLGVNVDADSEPFYLIPKAKEKVVKELRSALKNSDELILATDEDREGESIGWHLARILEPKVPVKRMVFSEITKEAIQEAIRQTRQIDDHLVAARLVPHNEVLAFEPRPRGKHLHERLAEACALVECIQLHRAGQRRKRLFIAAALHLQQAELGNRNTPPSSR